MEFLFYGIGAVLLVLTGAVVSGGLSLPHRDHGQAPQGEAQPDRLTRDLERLLAYGQEEEVDEI